MVDLVLLNSLGYCFHKKVFISHSILNDNLLGRVFSGCRVFYPFISWNISCHSLLTYKDSTEKTPYGIYKEVPLYVTLSLTVFIILSLA